MTHTFLGRMAALALLCAAAQALPTAPAQQKPAGVERFAENPIIRPAMLPGKDGQNINGPSLVRVPDWVEKPLGKYYLYFAHHDGRYIRLAYADDLHGAYSMLHLSVGDQQQIVHARANREVTFPIGALLRFDLDPEMVRFFDPKTEAAIKG